MKSPYVATIIICTALIYLNQTAVSLNDESRGCLNLVDGSCINVDHLLSNSTTRHIYPYLASFITFVCILVSLVIVITYAPRLGWILRNGICSHIGNIGWNVVVKYMPCIILAFGYGTIIDNKRDWMHTVLVCHLNAALPWRIDF